MKMKTITLLSCVLLVLTNSIYSQIPNSGFENWTTTGSYEEPTGWSSTNIVATGSYFPITKSTDHYPIGIGSYSLRLENNISILPSWAAMGMAQSNSTIGPALPAFPVTEDPNAFCGYYKFLPQGGDTLMISCLLYKEGVRIGHAMLLTTTEASDWTSFNESFRGMDGIAGSFSGADSAFVHVSTFNMSGPQSVPYGNSVLYIDNLSFNNLITSVNNTSSLNDNICNVFPNPAKDKITIEADLKYEGALINFYNSLGSLVKQELYKEPEKQTFNVSDLNPGIYFLEIKSNDGSITKKIFIHD